MNALPLFSHIYYERRARDAAITRAVRTRYSHLPQTEVRHYGEIFNRKRQNFQIQKRVQALILAVAQRGFLYQGTERIRSFGDTHVYYTDQVRNCVYNCSYCFLQGMHRSAHCILFVNETDYHDAALRHIKQTATQTATAQETTAGQETTAAQTTAAQETTAQTDNDLRAPLRPSSSASPHRPSPDASPQPDNPLYLSISYLSDLLALEHLVPLCGNWIEIARRHPRLHIEIRTKSNNIRALQHIAPIPNARLVWSLTPRAYAQRFEYGTASLPNRLMAARRAVELGWKVALCFDPIIYGDGWEREYHALLRETFDRLPPREIEAVSYGTFRMHRDYFRRMLDQQPRNDILLRDYRDSDDITTHDEHTRQKMRHAFERQIENFYPLKKVFFVHG